MDLKQAVLEDRLASYARLRGGFPIPLAGMFYWATLGVAGYSLDLGSWSMLAFVGSGAIFPLALLFAKIFNNPFMKDKTSVTTLLVPAFIGMLLFWPMIIGAVQVAPVMVPLILAIGLSIHWPVIGWMYGRTSIYAGHAIIRALAVTGIWLAMPDDRLTLLPFSVAVVYLLTVIIIFIDSGRVKGRA